mmetsp:Transcript_15239/g.50047  ORF Transcript_15239/g.50047 Transcript_15239/m.50047 type:complete len:115 (+) Transcript_15239:93-437(+)
MPQCAAVVHHGGAGTIAAGLRAGVPQVALPVCADHPFFAERMRVLGVGLVAGPLLDVPPERLAAALRCVLAPENGFVARAREVGERERGEDGAAAAAAVIERAVANNRTAADPA